MKEILLNTSYNIHPALLTYFPLVETTYVRFKGPMKTLHSNSICRYQRCATLQLSIRSCWFTHQLLKTTIWSSSTYKYGQGRLSSQNYSVRQSSKLFFLTSLFINQRLASIRFRVNSLKLVCVFFSQQMIAHQKLWKMHFISCKKFFLFFVFSSSPLFLPDCHCFRWWLKINLKGNDVT